MAIWNFLDDGVTHRTRDTSDRCRSIRSIAKQPGFTEGLLQLSIAIWIINYPIVTPFAATRQVGEFGGGGGGSGRGVRGGRLGQDVGFCGAATGLDDHFCASLAYIYHAQCLRILTALHQVLVPVHQQRAKQVLRHHLQLYGLTAFSKPDSQNPAAQSGLTIKSYASYM